MRIISGRFRGRRLKSPGGLGLRPTSDRLRETLFDILGPGVDGAVVLDVFAGAGGIGLEAISRGAREVVFVESNREAVRLIRDNLSLCGISSDYRILQGDAFSMLRSLAREQFAADITFLDPPYKWGPYRDLIEILFCTGIARIGARVVVEHHGKTALPDAGPSFRCVRTVRQSDKCLSFFQAINEA
ncbi:MAG: 16S rRNA (guanine(966)-N(2))-methyltransferase RsmD [Acidobacteriota bacterium]|jgi:16S rRNA (guanine(966)-N(2))-methyltransferase RsmD